MKIKRLLLKHFRQHVESEIHLDDGLTGIIGANGAGKTTLMEGIAFALYGSKAIRGKMEDLKSNQSKEGNILVELVFEISGTNYRLVRTAHDAELFIGGEAQPIVKGNREVIGRITQIIGMNYDEFIATFFTEQKALEFLSGKKGAAERERFIVRMMGYDALEKVQELLREERKDKRSATTGFEAGIGEKEELQSRLEECQKKKEVLEKQLTDEIAQLEKLDETVRSTKSGYETLELVYQEWKKRKDLVQNLEAKFLDRSERIKIRKQKLSELLEEVFEGKPLREFAPGEWHTALLGAKERQQNLLKQIGSLIEENHKEELKHKTIISSLAERRTLLAQELTKDKERAKKISALTVTAPCPTCGQELGQSFESVSMQAAEKVQEVEAALADLDAKLLDAKKSFSKNPREEVVATLQKEKASEEDRIQKLESIQSKIISIEQMESELHQLRDEIKVLDEELHKKRKDLSELRFDEGEYRSAKGKYDAAHELLNLARLKKLQVEGECKTQRALYDKAVSDLKIYEERSSRLTSLRKELIFLEEGDKLLTDFRKALNESIKPRLSEIAGDFLSALTDGLYTEVTIGADFAPYICEQGEIKPVISGGETDILHLSVRLALSQMIADRAGHPFSLLVLDEVFGSLDEQRRFNVLRLLEQLSNRFEQILVITHMDEIKDGVEHLLSLRFDDEIQQSVVEKESLESEYHF